MLDLWDDQSIATSIWPVSFTKAPIVQALFSSLLAVAYAASAQAASSAEEFDVTRWPVQPTLTVDAAPDVCKPLLSVVTDQFMSAAADLDMATAIRPTLPPVAMKPAFEGAQQGASSLTRADLDLDGSGQMQVVIYRDDEFNYKANWHYAYVFPSAAAFDAVKSKIAAEWLQVPQGAAYGEVNKTALGAQQYYPDALTTQNESVQTGDVWADHALFEVGHRYYFLFGTTDFDRNRPQPVLVFRLRANGRVELACRIETLRVDQLYGQFQQLPALASLLKSIRRIGTGEPDQGTLHAGATHDTEATAAEIRAAYRPWAASAAKGGYYQYDIRASAFLEDWSYQELWTRREYQTLLELMGPAEANYADYLRSRFGVRASAATTDAVTVVQQLIGARLEVPSQFDVAAGAIYFPSTPLHRAVMLRDPSAFDEALAPAQLAQARPFGRPQSNWQILSAALLDAVEWPDGLDKLLTAGADPNATNAFGKTPLMVAAHFNRVDAVRKLLKAGANVNAATVTSTTEWLGSPRAGRTALMYAAENAGPAVIKALLDAGADPQAQDAEGNGMKYYLSNNPRFTDDERALGVTGLARTADQFAGPSFDCRKARANVEKAICGSEVLRIFDLEGARAFERLRQKDPSLLAEQRQWLRMRDRGCANGTDVDCLAELMRTHERSLQDRLMEGVAAAAKVR